MNSRLLFVEDEENLAKLVSLQLRVYGFDVDLAFDGEEARHKISSERYRLILLDRMFPEGSGLSLLKEIKDNTDTPIIFVTALSAPEHIIEGLEAGADDYVTKPFDERVLVSRIRAVLRRYDQKHIHLAGAAGMGTVEPSASSSGGATATWVSVGPISVNSQAFEARLYEQKLPLTRSEFLLLEALIMQKGCVLTRQQLIKTVQGDGVNVTGRTVDTHIFGLRKKLEDAADLIETIRGVGYRMHFDEV
ncbi:MAG: response regulator transcription factor [Bdellovibrionaceae bacterium]|nr:response regulator transcription factor [Pseudobdellovibrionaceae bacterium]